MPEEATGPDRPAADRQENNKLFVRTMLCYLVVLPTIVSLLIGYITVMLVLPVEGGPGLVPVLVGALVWLPPAALGWFGTREAWRYTNGGMIATSIVAAWVLAAIELVAMLMVFDEAIHPGG